MFISPRSTLKNCGISSSDYLRRNRPGLLMRESLVTLISTPSRSFKYIIPLRRSSASRTMERNLVQRS